MEIVCFSRTEPTYESTQCRNPEEQHCHSSYSTSGFSYFKEKRSFNGYLFLMFCDLDYISHFKIISISSNLNSIFYYVYLLLQVSSLGTLHGSWYLFVNSLLYQVQQNKQSRPFVACILILHMGRMQYFQKF